MPPSENGSSEFCKWGSGCSRPDGYPRRGDDLIQNENDRQDHFLAAELMILGTSGGRKTLEFLQRSKVFGGRLALIKSIKGERGQLSLEGIIKRLLRNGETITNFTLDRFFEEMKACLYPKTTTNARITSNVPSPVPNFPTAPTLAVPEKIVHTLKSGVRPILPSKPSQEPLPEYRRFILPGQLFVFDAFYGWDEVRGAFVGPRKTVEQIAEETRMPLGKIQELLQMAQIRAFPASEEVISEPEIIVGEPEEEIIPPDPLQRHQGIPKDGNGKTSEVVLPAFLKRDRRKPQLIPKRNRLSPGLPPASSVPISDPDAVLGTGAGFQELIRQSVARGLQQRRHDTVVRPRPLSKKQPDPVQPDLVPPPDPVVEKKPIECPEFQTSQEAFSWLLEQGKRIKEWKGVYIQINEVLGLPTADDMKIIGILSTQPNLQNIVVNLRRQLKFKTFKEFFQALFSFSVNPTASPSDVSSPDALNEVPESHLTEISDILALHTAGQHREFWEACHGLSQEVLHSIRLLDGEQHANLFEALFAVGGVDFSGVSELYRIHSWETRVCHLPGVTSALEPILTLGHHSVTMNMLHERLVKVRVCVPENFQDEWHGFDEIGTPERTLLDIVTLITQSPEFHTAGEKPVRTMFRVIRKIMGVEEGETE